MDDNEETTLHCRPFKDSDKEWVSKRQWIDRQVWLLNDGKTAMEEGCPSDPFYQGQWADRERIGMFLVSKLCTKGNGCTDERCKFIVEVLMELG